MYYWSREEKKGQFLPDFEKREGVRGSAAHMYQRGYKPKALANVAENPNNNDNTYTFMTMDDTHLKVATPPPVANCPPNDVPSTSSNYENNLEHGTGGVEVVNTIPEAITEPIIAYYQWNRDIDMLTLIDSRASDHCFTNQEAFSTYTNLD